MATSPTSPVPIRAHLASDLEGKSNTQPSYFIKVYVDDAQTTQSEKKFSVPTLLWEWNNDHQFLVHPLSTLKIVLYRKSRIIIKHLVGEHVGKVINLLENDVILDLKDRNGTEITTKIKISLSLVSDSQTDENFKSFMEAVDSNVDLLKSAGRVLPGNSSLGIALQLTKNIMDIVADAHPILKASWTVLSVVYAAVQQVELLDDAIQDLAGHLRELLGVVKELPSLPVIPDTTNITEEIGRASLKVALLISEYTKPSFISRTTNIRLSNDMKKRITECQKFLNDLKEKFNIRVMMAIQSRVTEIKGEMDKNNMKIQRILETIKGDQRANDIYQWLSAPDSSNNYNDALKKHQKDTCSWFLDGVRFRELLEKSDFVWIKGAAGSGKTVLCSSVIQKIIELCEEKESSYYAYFFFDGRDSQQDLQLHDKLIRSLIHQFSLQCGGIPAPLMVLYKHGNQQPSTSALQDTLYRIIDGLKSVYIIIDSLDECADRKEMLQWISDISSRKVDNLHMLVTSRPERGISNILYQHDPRCIDLASEDNHDISIYLDKQLELEKKWDAETREIVKSQLQAGAGGMFRWVALQLIELRKCSNQHSVMKDLKHLPQSLNETYDRILQRIDDNDRADSKTFLKWLCFSIRPITLTELSETITVDFDGENEPRFMPSRRYWDSEDILEKCPGFITESKGQVKLAHFSIKEYLMSDRLRMGALAHFHLTEEPSHSSIAQICLAYLLQFDAVRPSSVIVPSRSEKCNKFAEADDDSESAEYSGPEDSSHSDESDESHNSGKFAERNKATKSAPLAEYTAQHWIIHAQLGGIDKPDCSVTLALAKKLFTPHGAVFAHWVSMWDLDQEENWELSQSDSEQANIPSPLYYASLAGLRWVTQHLLEDGDPNVLEGRYGNPLQAASHKGHEVIAKLLLEKGADVHLQGGEYGSALQAASAGRHGAVAKTLVEKGADVNMQGGYYGNALLAASFEGSEEVVELLLERGADINAQGGYYGHALQGASARGSEAVVKVLVMKGANVNAQGGEYGNALQAASARGHKAVVELLLEKGADVNAQGGLYGHALQAASRDRYEAIVKLLLEEGADVNAQGGHFGNALQGAAYNTSEAVARLLLEKGANVNAQGGLYGSALQAASFKGSEAVVNLLLEKGAHVNMQGGLHGNALQAATVKEHAAVVKLLLKKGADQLAR